MKKHELLEELEIYSHALIDAKDPFKKAILNFEISCILKDLQEYE